LFNLLVGRLDGSVPVDRFLEYTEPQLAAELKSDPLRVESMPALLMPEIGDAEREQFAQIGTVTQFKRGNRDYFYKFVPSTEIAPIDAGTVQELATQLNIGDWEFQRTHWAVKDVNLFQILFEHASAKGQPRPGTSSSVRFPVESVREPDLVAVMMPFDEAFDVVYETIAAAVANAGMRAVRADDIWIHDHVMDDVLSLIWRSKVVIADLTGKNPNVFYEVGLSHAIGRDSILMTQNSDDVPFDLKPLRYVEYSVGTAGRARLGSQLTERLSTLRDRVAR
jgi:hypothetical protein